MLTLGDDPAFLDRLSAWRLLLIFVCGLTHSGFSVSKPHVIAFGKWVTVQWFPGTGAADEKPLTLKVRPLLVDARVKEIHPSVRRTMLPTACSWSARLPGE